MEDKGRLIFSSPQCPKERRIVISFFYLLIIICGIGIFIYSIIYDPYDISLILICLFFFLGCLFGGSLIVSELYPHFRIYERGVAEMVEHTLHPWVDCNKIKPSLGSNPQVTGRIDTNFIAWDNIACYEIEYLDINELLEKRRAPIVLIHLKEIKSKNHHLKRGNPIYFDFQTPFQSNDTKTKWRGIMYMFINMLKQRGIPEIPRICPNCHKEPSWPIQKCPNCGFKRY